MTGLASSSRVTLETLGAWVIKCNPAKTDVAPFLAAGQTKPSWCVADNYRSQLIQPGHRVLFWVTAHPRRGIWGAGQITGNVSVDDGQLHVPVHISLFTEPVTAAALSAVSGLRSMEVFRSPQQANPSWVSTAELTLLERFLPSAGIFCRPQVFPAP
ncbi:MAG: hypothetical protein ABWY93_02200 [Mycobacterium sp.]